MATQAGLTIADAARLSGVSAYTLRYYERAGLIDGVDRSGSGHRRYSDDDLAWIEVLQCLRATGMPIAGIRRYAELVRDGDIAIYEEKLNDQETAGEPRVGSLCPGPGMHGDDACLRQGG